MTRTDLAVAMTMRMEASSNTVRVGKTSLLVTAGLRLGTFGMTVLASLVTMRKIESSTNAHRVVELRLYSFFSLACTDGSSIPNVVVFDSLS